MKCDDQGMETGLSRPHVVSSAEILDGPLGPPPCTPSTEYNPVCVAHDWGGPPIMKDNKYAAMCGGYRSWTTARTENGKRTCKLPRRMGCAPSPTYNPVCAGKYLYYNAEAARCRGHTRVTPPRKAADGTLQCPLPTNCKVTAERAPVCAYQKPYANYSAAVCDGNTDENIFGGSEAYDTPTGPACGVGMSPPCFLAGKTQAERDRCCQSRYDGESGCRNFKFIAPA